MVEAHPEHPRDQAGAPEAVQKDPRRGPDRLDERGGLCVRNRIQNKLEVAQDGIHGKRGGF